MPTTFDRLRLILVRDYKADADVVTPDMPLANLNIDSLGVAELLFTIEDDFKVRVKKEPVEMTTVGDVVRFIDALVAEGHDVEGPAGGLQPPSAET